MSKRGHNEGSIYKRDDGLWVAVVQLGYINGKRKRKYIYGDTRSEVKDKLNAALYDQQQGLPIAPEKQTVEQYMTRWVDKSVKPHRAAKTYFSYQQMMRLYIFPALGRIKLAKLTPQDVQDFMNQQLESGLSPRTVQYCHAILRRALNQAMRWEYVPRNVATLVDIPRQERKESEFLTVEEAKKLLGSIRGDRLEALYTVAMALGLRKGEALGLQWKDIDFSTRTITVKVALQWIRGQRPVLKDTKTDGSHRRLILPGFAVETLRAHQRQQNVERELLGSAWQDTWGLVFTTSHGTPLNERNVTRSFHRMLKRAGMDRMRFYDMRHTCASLLLAQGVPLRVVMEVLGHSQIALTANLYTHVMPSLLGDVAEGMENMFKDN